MNQEEGERMSGKNSCSPELDRLADTKYLLRQEDQGMEVAEANCVHLGYQLLVLLH